MSLFLDLEIECPGCTVPDYALLQTWAANSWQVLQPGCGNRGICLRVVGESESAALNQRYRGKPGATNVLSFPAELPGQVVALLDTAPLGDIAICGTLVATEARQQGKEPEAHWAHLLIHGLLHLLGYDHQSDGEAELMEAEETRLLEHLGFGHPYGEPRHRGAVEFLRND